VTPPLQAGRNEDQELAYQTLIRGHEEQIRRSNRFPNVILAWLLGLGYCLDLILAAVFLRLTGSRKPTGLHQRLAEFYHYVPEMALHKAIELEALKPMDRQGRGLDLGCGNGQVGGVLRSETRLEDLHGVDLMAYNGPLARENGYRSFVAGNIEVLPYADLCFDYVFSICVLEHIPDLRKVLKETLRVLKPEGQLSFTTPAPRFRVSTLGYLFWSALGQEQRAQRFQERRDLQSAHFHYRSAEAWTEHLTELGFTEIEVKPIFGQHQHLLYEVMNSPVNFLQFYFSDKLSIFLARHPWPRALVRWATAQIAAAFSSQVPTMDDATHFLISCRGKDPV
jgi:SAM-dependent methyltransferase